MLSTLAGVQAAGFRVAVAAPPTGLLAEELCRRGVECLPFEVRDAQGQRRPLEELRRSLADLLDCHRPDLLHANSLSMGRLSGPVARQQGMASVAHLRDIVGMSRRALADLNGHRRLLAVSEATRAFHVTAGLDGRKTYVLHNGVDLDEFRPREPSGFLHRELGLNPGAHLVATIGQIGLRKGQDVLVRAAATVARRRDDVHWLIVGERFSEKEESRQFEANLQAAAECESHSTVVSSSPCFSGSERAEAATRPPQSLEGPLWGRLHLLGRRNDVPRLLNELALLVHPARQEPLGRVLLEAAGAGAAVIATDVGGTREIFPLGDESAQLVAPDDAEALAEAVVSLLGDDVRRRQLGAAARRRAQDAFDLRAATDGLIRHYAELV